MDTKQTNPIQDLFTDIKKIIDFIEVKDINEANSYETADIRNESEMWINALLEMDTYLTYKTFWNIAMFQEVLPNVKLNNIRYWMEKPLNIPLDFRDVLLTKGRQVFLNSYEEKNTYYRMLNGLPPYETPADKFVYISAETAKELHAPTDVPIHKLSSLIQNSFISTDEYTDLVANNPDKKYLKYLGLYKIDIFTARRAKDFELIRYYGNSSSINPNLAKEFGILYTDYREYVMTTLYNKQLEDVYDNYRTFMGLLIKSFTLMQISNKAVESVHDRKYLDDTVLHIILSMHGIPKSLLMTKEVRRNLVINMLKLTREKGTDDVYYNLVRILGYQDIIISKLMLMKNQQFDETDNHKLVFDDGNNLDNFSNIDTIGVNQKHLKVDPSFVQINLLDKNPYESIMTGKAPIHDYKKIIDADPTWWDTQDTKDLLNNSDYTISDSKYIMVEAVIHQIKYLFESIYFTRLILDNRKYTDEFMINIPEVFGVEAVSVYDIMVYILAATCMNNGLTGEIAPDESSVIATAGFNFSIDLKIFEEFINTTRYVDKSKIMSFIEDLTMRDKSDINRLFNDIMYPMREWLELKISQSTKREEFLEYESVYRSLFTYDATHSNFLDEFQLPMEIIRQKYELTADEMLAFCHFYPRTIAGQAVTIDTYHNSRYKTPFLSYNNNVTWNFHITIDTPYGVEDRGVVYFHDILNLPDLRELTNSNGTRVFMDYEDPKIGWEVNEAAVEKLIYLINELKEDELQLAYFQIDTPILNSGGKVFNEGEKLPANIRNGIFKEILIDKVIMDILGLSVPPKTYLEYLERKNEKLYNLLVADNRFNLNKDLWLEDIMKVVLVLETELNMHMKYFEQSVVGSELFFKPLITLIKHFKSTFVDFAKTGLKYDMGDKIDSGGNSNMFKIFDDIKLIIHFVVLATRGYDSQFGLYDTEHKLTHHILMKDRPQLITFAKGGGFNVSNRKSTMGSIRMVDEAKFSKNGKSVDPSGHSSAWYSGESGTGRWSEEDDIIMRTRNSTERVVNLPVDTNAWKSHVESYNPN
jgi:hypothetical protein